MTEREFMDPATLPKRSATATLLTPKTVATFAEGDVVQLASGGPRMTVTSINSAESVSCMWFTDAGQIHQAGFRLAWLRKAESANLAERGKK